MLGQEGRTELLSGAPAQKRAHKGRPGQLPGLWRGQGTAPRMSRAPGKPWATSPWAQLPLTLQWHCPLVLLQSGSKPLFTSQLQGPQVGFPHQPFGHCWSILGRRNTSAVTTTKSPRPSPPSSPAVQQLQGPGWHREVPGHIAKMRGQHRARHGGRGPALCPASHLCSQYCPKKFPPHSHT